MGLVAITVFQCFSSPLSRRHELNFKQADAFVNANVAKDKATILMCSAFIESNFQPMPTDLTSENALVSQLSYYPINAPVVFLPMSLNDQAMQIGSQTVLAAAQRHQRFLAIAPPPSYPTLEWLATYSRGASMARVIGDFEEVVVVEFLPVGGND